MNQSSLRAVGLHCDYQPEVDLLFAWLGEPEAAENIEVEAGIYVRVVPGRKEVVGIEVVDCAERFDREPSTIDAAFAQTLLERYTRPALEKLAAARPHPTLFSSPQ